MKGIRNACRAMLTHSFVTKARRCVLPVFCAFHESTPCETEAALPPDMMRTPSEPPTVIIWRNLLGVLFMHIGAVVALWHFSWISFSVGLLLGAVTLQCGLVLCFHRLLTHRSFKVPRWLEAILTFIGCLAFQAGPIAWVATHRYHHKHSDDPLDPHSPRLSFFWAHIGWTLIEHPEIDRPDKMRRLCPDLAADQLSCWLQQHMTHVNLAAAAGLWVIGWMVNGQSLGWSMLLWGFCMRVVIVWHVVFLVNSAAHLWGYRTYDTPDQSCNNWWVALLTFGEGWHNNHHADQRAAAHGHCWWEIDTTYCVIRVLAWLGLATEIVGPSPRLYSRRLPGTTAESR